MFCNIMYNNIIHICVSPRNGHYHACKWHIHADVKLKHFHYKILNKPFYMYLRSIDNVNSPNYLFLSLIHPYANKNKTYSLVMLYVPILAVIIYNIRM